MKKKIKNPACKKRAGFTLPEMLVAVAIFATATTIVGSLYVYSFRETRRANIQNQIYEDARFILKQIADEVKNGAIDYDEYYNQLVVSAQGGSANFGQNFGAYYSSFYNSGSDQSLGFDCNTVDPAVDGPVGSPARTAKRNLRTCTPLRRTVDRNTGENPFTGKVAGASQDDENAFCGTVSYESGGASFDNEGECDAFGAPLTAALRPQEELYLISQDGFKKTIFARERIGGSESEPVYALSVLRLDGSDSNNDGVADGFACAGGFQCVKTSDCSSALLPRSRAEELAALNDACDGVDAGFSKDFVPVSPLRVNISRLAFHVFPSEDPHYAFSESDELAQPRVTISLQVSANPDVAGVRGEFLPIELVQTVSTRLTLGVAAPVLIK